MTAPLLDGQVARPESHVRRLVGGENESATPNELDLDAARSLHLRTKLLRRIAHDIASPAGVTTSALQELANEGTLRPELVAMARRGLRRLLRLSEQLAVVADLEAGSLTPDTTLEETRTVVKSALDQALAIDGRREITTAFEARDSERLPIEIDRRLVESVVREIIGNALRLASSRVLVEVREAAGACEIHVHDDGPGFSSESLATLGERFTSSGASRGQGLSLSIAKDVLAAHGGALRVERSTLPPGRRQVPGAAVVITLPLAALSAQVGALAAR